MKKAKRLQHKKRSRCFSDEIADPNNVPFKLFVNGQIRHDAHTSDLIYNCQKLISLASDFYTLYPGDVIWMGTDGLPQNMKVGDVCEVEIPGIGILRNPVVAETR